MGLVGAGIGLSMLTDCKESFANIYKSRDDCLNDYSASQCFPYGPTANAYYRGPQYRTTRSDATDPGPGRYYERTGVYPHYVDRTEVSHRGGFGCNGKNFHVSS